MLKNHEAEGLIYREVAGTQSFVPSVSLREEYEKTIIIIKKTSTVTLLVAHG